MAGPTPTLPTSAPPALIAMRRRRLVRRGRRLVLVGSIVAAIGGIGWLIGRQMIAATWLATDRIDAAWQVTWDDWARGGSTRVYSASRTRFGLDRTPHPVPDLRYLGWLVHVATLDLSEVGGLRDDDLAILDRLPDLTSAGLSRPNRGAGVAPGRDDGPRLTDATLARVGRLRKLESLSFAGQGATDAGLRAIEGLDRLEDLDLEANPITDAGLASLAKLKKLKYVDLSGTGVTPAGAQSLQVAIPGLQVTLTPGGGPQP